MSAIICPAHSFELVARQAKGEIRHRSVCDRNSQETAITPIIFMQCGPIRHRVDAKEQAARNVPSNTSSWCETDQLSASARGQS